MHVACFEKSDGTPEEIGPDVPHRGTERQWKAWQECVDALGQRPGVSRLSVHGRGPAAVFFLLGHQFYHASLSFEERGETFLYARHDTVAEETKHGTEETKHDGVEMFMEQLDPESNGAPVVDLVFLCHNSAHTVRGKLGALPFRVRRVYKIVLSSSADAGHRARVCADQLRRVLGQVSADPTVSKLLFACAAWSFFALVAGTELRRSVVGKTLELLELQKNAQNGAPDHYEIVYTL